MTGGALAKLAVKAPLGDGIVGMLATLSAIASTLLMLHFLRCLMPSASHDREAPAPTGLVVPWLAVALASVVLPWMLYPAIADASFHDALTPKILWEALWPVLGGGLLAVVLQRWANRLPRVPEGDVLLAGMRATRAPRYLGAVMEQIDGHVSQWSVAALLFLALTLMLAGAMFAGH